MVIMLTLSACFQMMSCTDGLPLLTGYHDTQVEFPGAGIIDLPEAPIPVSQLCCATGLGGSSPALTPHSVSKAGGRTVGSKGVGRPERVSFLAETSLFAQFQVSRHVWQKNLQWVGADRT